ncbi:MAG TPA: hypothetical protein VHX11_08890, partial [Acidobacteriaceae bacterium]|nr:hypothetical protein [Acidobacteriaceae bacterium]
MPIAAIGSLAGGIVSGIGSLAAGSSQSRAAQQALQLQKQNQQAAVAAQTQETQQQQQNEQPFLNVGTQGANSLANFLNTPFQAPTLAQAEQNPGYQFALQQGTQALDQSAAATGNLYSGTQGKALEQYGQGLGEQNYQQVYNNAMQQYMNQYGILSNTANLGANVAGQIGQQGQAAAN